MTYDDRRDAGKQLANALHRFKGADIVVMALPRGGVVLGLEIAEELQAPLGLVLVRKIGHPSFAEYAVGAVAEGGTPLFNESEASHLDEEWLDEAVAAARNMIKHRRKLYFGNDFAEPDVENKTVIIVDDGIATGLTMEVAVRAIRDKAPNKVIVAAPVASRESVAVLEQMADEVVLLEDPKKFLGAVGAHYRNFDQVDDDEVRELLREASVLTMLKNEEREQPRAIFLNPQD